MRIGEDPRGKVYQDGGVGIHNMPGRIAERELKKLWPQKDPVIISVGCGISKIKTRKEGASLRFPSRLYEAYAKSSGWEDFISARPERENRTYIRLDPLLDAEQIVRLDDCEKILALQDRLETEIEVDAEMLSRAEWLAVANLFSFEFEKVPCRNNGEKFYDCQGLISCKYGNNKELVAQLQERFTGNTIFRINEMHDYPFKIPCPVSFKLLNLDNKVHINLHTNSQELSISGLPDKANNIYRMQQRCHQGQYALSLKRKLDEVVMNSRSQKTWLIPNSPNCSRMFQVM